jgi:hypothetical protein
VVLAVKLLPVGSETESAALTAPWTPTLGGLSRSMVTMCPAGLPAEAYEPRTGAVAAAPLADMKRAAASTAARNNGPGGDSAAGASPLTTVDRILDSPATDAEIRSAEP